MSIEAFNLSCVVVLPDGTIADVQQTDIQRGTRQDMTFFVAVRPHGAKPSFTGALHLSGSTLANLDACPGDTRRDKATLVTTALLTWVREHGLVSDFALNITVGDGNGDPCHVSISPARS